jgi:hypothetical protein
MPLSRAIGVFIVTARHVPALIIRPGRRHW